MKRLMFVLFIVCVFSSCQIASMVEDDYLYEHLGTHEVYTCDWINAIDDIADIQATIRQHITYATEEDHYTQSPKETCTLGTGNCTDMSILMMSILYTNFGLKSNLVAVEYAECKTVVAGGLSVDHAIVECNGVYYECTAKYYKIYTYVEVCYRYTFSELFPYAK